MEETDEGSAANDRRYAMLDKRDIPGGENLKVTLERALPFWQDEIAPALLDNKNCFSSCTRQLITRSS